MGEFSDSVIIQNIIYFYFIITLHYRRNSINQPLR
jgi:hypothetical protein